MLGTVVICRLQICPENEDTQLIVAMWKCDANSSRDTGSQGFRRNLFVLKCLLRIQIQERVW